MSDRDKFKISTQKKGGKAALFFIQLFWLDYPGSQ